MNRIAESELILSADGSVYHLNLLPGGCEIRARSSNPELMSTIQQFSYGGQRITNLEMETAGIYGMAAALGHSAISFNVILANRITQTFSQQPELIMDNYIEKILSRLVNIL